jgi:hypothetical protein
LGRIFAKWPDCTYPSLDDDAFPDSDNAFPNADNAFPDADNAFPDSAFAILKGWRSLSPGLAQQRLPWVLSRRQQP